MKSVIIFASGAGTNAAAIIAYFKENQKAHVSLIVCNNENAGVLDIAKREHIPFLIINKKTFNEVLLIEQLHDFKPSIIVLAGFHWKIPAQLLHEFPGKVINIHPALLPAHGGKGMYGIRVHQSVIDHKEKHSGITIHHVNEHYDEGDIIMQARCNVHESDTADDVAHRIHKLEHFYFPRTIEFLLENNSF